MVSTQKRFKFYRVFKKQKTDGVDALLGTGSAPPGVTGTRHFPRSPWRELGSWVARLQGGPSPECLHDTPRGPLCRWKLHQHCPQTPSQPCAAPGTHGGLTRLSSAALCWCLREQQGAASPRRCDRPLGLAGPETRVGLLRAPRPVQRPCSLTLPGPLPGLGRSGAEPTSGGGQAALTRFLAPRTIETATLKSRRRCRHPVALVIP